MSELCLHCMKVTRSVVVHHVTGTEWLCSECGHQVDFMDTDEWYDYALSLREDSDE